MPSSSPVPVSSAPRTRPTLGTRRVAGSMSKHGTGRSDPTFSQLPPDAQWRASEGRKASAPSQILSLLNYVTKADAGFLFSFSGEVAGDLSGAETPAGDAPSKRVESKVSCEDRRFHGKQDVGSALAAEAEALSLRATTTARFAHRSVRCAMGRYLLVSVPFVLSEKQITCLVVAVSNRSSSDAATVASVIQGHGWWLTQAELAGQFHREVSIFERVTGFVDLLGRCADAGDDEELCSIQAHLLRDILDCESVSFVGMQKGQLRCLANSGGQDSAVRSEGATHLERAVAEAIRRKEPIYKDPSAPETKTRSGFGSEFAQLFRARGFVVTPLMEGDHRVGGWVALWTEDDPQFEEKKQFLDASAEQAAPLLRLLRKVKPSGAYAMLRRVWSRLGQSRQRLVLMILVAMIGVGFFPVRERLEAPLVLEPTVRRVIAAPFEATLRATVVEAGDFVSEGDILARLDGREIRFALVEAIANRTRAEKEADRALDAGKVAEAQMARLEAESHAQQQKLNEAKQERLEVRSPIEGLVLQGDLERAEGTPLRTGDRLFEIAPIETLLVELALPESEISRVRVGMSVRLKLEAYPGETIEAEVRRVPLRSEVRDGKNVFVCEASIPNEEGQFRPGMKGEAKVLGDRRFFLWTLIRPAVNFCRLKLWI